MLTTKTIRIEELEIGDLLGEAVVRVTYNPEDPIIDADDIEVVDADFRNDDEIEMDVTGHYHIIKNAVVNVIHEYIN